DLGPDRRQQREAALGGVVAGQQVATHHQPAARAEEGEVQRRRLVVEPLPVRVAAELFDGATGPAVEQGHQLLVAGGAHEVTARGHLAEVTHLHRHRPCHAPSSASCVRWLPSPATTVSGAACPATVAGSRSPRCQSPPPPVWPWVRMSIVTDTFCALQVRVLLSSRCCTWAICIIRAKPLAPGASSTSTVRPSLVTAVIFAPGTAPGLGHWKLSHAGGVLR